MKISKSYTDFNIQTQTVKTELNNLFYKEELYFKSLNDFQFHLFSIKYYKICNNSVVLNNYLGNPANTRYYLFTKNIDFIQYWENGKVSKVNGPAYIKYNVDGSIHGEVYYFNGNMFPSKEEHFKQIKLINIA